MKNRTSNLYKAALMFLIILNTACKKESLDGIRSGSFNTSFDLQLAEKILLKKSPNQQLKVELRSLNDYRCDDAHPCENSGYATARVLLSDPDHQAEAETNLCIGMCGNQNKTSDAVAVIIDGKKYTLILKKVIGSLDKKAELQININ